MIEDTFDSCKFLEEPWRWNEVVKILPSNISVFQENVWALKWLWDSLSSSAERLSSFLQEIKEEMENTTGNNNQKTSQRIDLANLALSNTELP